MKKIKKYASFEEMEDEQLAYMASLTPIELLANLKMLVLHSFGYRAESEIPKQNFIINTIRNHQFYE